MAIWQFRLILISEKALLSKYDVLPLAIPMELAEDFAWWSEIQPRTGFERHIDLILPRMESWSSKMRMWGHEDHNDACVSYVDETKTTIKEISFRLDVQAISPDLLGGICKLARHLECVLMTAEYEILAPDEAMVLTTIHNSTARGFVDDPVSTLESLDQSNIQERFRYLMKDTAKTPPPKE